MTGIQVVSATFIRENSMLPTLASLAALHTSLASDPTNVHSVHVTAFKD